jgi:UDP-N-acetylmuramoyl-tripeptide--D-alanyl-D-alanine ligase
MADKIEEIYGLLKQADFAVSTDTRSVAKGSVFFALKGSNFNGNAFAKKAIEGGAMAAIIDEPACELGEQFILVKDVLTALQQVATHHRRTCHMPLLAITGSNGKTTTKELVNAVVSKKFNTLCTTGNLNNHIGVPLTLLRLKQEHEFAIIEMGANHQKEIMTLCEIAEPTYGMITNIGRAHLEGFGGIEGVKKGKGEMFDYLRHNKGMAFVNRDDSVIMEMSKGLKVFTYGTSPDCDVHAQDITNGEQVSLKFSRTGQVQTAAPAEAVHTQITGRYNFVNCVAAAAIGNYFGVEERWIREALSEYVPAMNRSQLVNTSRNKVLLDAYNANPDSMRAALQNFADYNGNSKIVVLGDMFELGEFSSQEHQRVAALAESLNLKAILVGKEFSKVTSAALKFGSTEECLAYLRSNELRNKTVLVKGSRSMKMETLMQAL